MNKMKTKFMQNKREKNQRFFQYNFFPKNRKANIPVTILVIGVFAVCGLALLSFFNSAIETRESFIGIDLMEKINSQIEEYNFDIGTEDSKEFFYQEKNETYLAPEWGFNWLKQKTLFSVKYIKKLE